MIGLKRHTLQIVDHQPGWAALAAEACDDIRQAISNFISDVQHVGSTAVPDLPAKPILDLAAAVSSMDTIQELVSKLCEIGYIYRCNNGEDGGHLFVRETSPDIRTIHLHLVEHNGSQWRNYIFFRELLRRNPNTRELYAELKKNSVLNSGMTGSHILPPNKISFEKSLEPRRSSQAFRATLDCCTKMPSLEGRFEIRKTRYISERFEKSPNITEHFSVSDHLHISYAPQDASILHFVQKSFLQAYMFTREWFFYQNDLELDLWMAPEVIDLQYMTCLSCDENFFCAPGSRRGRKVILFVTPVSCKKNRNKSYLSSSLAHEITHHIVQEISHATIFSMKRKENLDVPMWLEEGLCQLVQADIYPQFHCKFAEDISTTTKWYDPADLWNDLSSCKDTKTAYLQAYKETKSLVKKIGKKKLFDLLYLNRTHEANWDNLP